MQDSLLQVFVVALGLLMYPNNGPYIEEWDDASTLGMQEYEQNLLREGEKLNQEMAPSDHPGLQDDETQFINVEADLHNANKEEDNGLQQMFGNEKDAEVLQVNQDQDSHLQQGLQSTEAIQMAQTQKPTSKTVEMDYIWIIWRTFSLISFIHFLWKHGQRNDQVKMKRTNSFSLTNVPEDIPLIDSRTLQIFHSQCIAVASTKRHREAEFLDVFVNDLLESIKKVCKENGGIAIEEVDIEDIHNVIVPLTLPEPYFFKSLCSHQAEGALLDMQTWGQIQLMKNDLLQNGCPCQASDAADDMVCLVHSENDKVKMKMSHAFDERLCKRGSNFLSKAQVGRWFQRNIRQAWSLISFKYEFEVSLCSNDYPGGVLVRFRSGEKMYFTMNPVIRFDIHSHFFITSCSPVNLDTFWCLSLSGYEDAFFNEISKRLPSNSCHIQTLEIAVFLHKKQTMLTGSNALKDSHFKTALMHLILTKKPSEWRPEFVASRLQDVLAFIMSSLKTKQLYHVLTANSLAQKIIPLPTGFIPSNPVNLFHPLVVHKCIYKTTMMHFEELLKKHSNSD